MLAPLALLNPEAPNSEGFSPESGATSDQTGAGIFAALIAGMENIGLAAGELTAPPAQCAGDVECQKLSEQPWGSEMPPEWETGAWAAEPLGVKSLPLAPIEPDQTGPLQLGSGEKKTIEKNYKKEEAACAAWTALNLAAAQPVQPSAPAPILSTPVALADSEAFCAPPEHSAGATEARAKVELPALFSSPESETAARPPAEASSIQAQPWRISGGSDSEQAEIFRPAAEPVAAAGFDGGDQASFEAEATAPVSDYRSPEAGGKEPPAVPVQRSSSAGADPETEPDIVSDRPPATYPVWAAGDKSFIDSPRTAAPEQHRLSAAVRQPFASAVSETIVSPPAAPEAVAAVRTAGLPAVDKGTAPPAGELAFGVRITQPPEGERPIAGLGSPAGAPQQKSEVLFPSTVTAVEAGAPAAPPAAAVESHPAVLLSNETSPEKATGLAAPFQKNRERLSSPSEVSTIERPPAEQPGFTSVQHPAAAASLRPAMREPPTAAQAQQVEPKPVSEPAALPNQFRIRLQPGSEQPAVDVRVRETSGQVQVAVRTPDGALASALRERLPDLAAELDRRGYSFEIWRPQPVATARQSAAAGPETASLVMAASRGAGGNAGGAPDSRHPQNGYETGSSFGGERRYGSDRQPDERKEFLWEWLEQ